MLIPRRVLDPFSGVPSGQPGQRMDRVMAVLRLLFLLAALAAGPEPFAPLASQPVVGLAAFAAYLSLALLLALLSPARGDEEDSRRHLLFTAELVVLSALLFLYGPGLPVLFVLFFFPIAGFFQPIFIKQSLFVALFLSTLYVALMQVMGLGRDGSGIAGALLLLIGGVTAGYLGERSRWNSVQMGMLRRSGEILKRDVSFDELLADLLREMALYYPIERVILVSAEGEGGPGRLKQARRVAGEVLYEEIEFLREEVQHLFPLEVFSGFYVNQVGKSDPGAAQFDFLEGREIEGGPEIPKLFSTLFNVRSVLSTPILRQDRTLGRVFLINRTRGAFTDKDIHFLKQLCDRHLRPMLENLQLVEKSQALAILEERNRIAMDLHDSFIQTLASLDIRLEVSRRILEKDVAGGLEELRRISQIVKSEYLEVRSYMNRLRNYVPEISRLEEQLDAFLERFQKDHGLPVEVTISRGPGPLADTLRNEILQIVREGLSNVVRHARATKVTLSIDVAQEEVRIRIQDDGQGMPPENGAGSPPARPWTILQRTENLSGKLEVDSSPGEGTCISVFIPLRRNP